MALPSFSVFMCFGYVFSNIGRYDKIFQIDEEKNIHNCFLSMIFLKLGSEEKF